MWKTPAGSAIPPDRIQLSAKNRKFNISNALSEVCQAGHFVCNLLILQVWLELSSAGKQFCTGFSTDFVDNFKPDFLDLAAGLRIAILPSSISPLLSIFST